jgi:hypothetical protein
MSALNVGRKSDDVPVLSVQLYEFDPELILKCGNFFMLQVPATFVLLIRNYADEFFFGSCIFGFVIFTHTHHKGVRMIKGAVSIIFLTLSLSVAASSVTPVRTLNPEHEVTVLIEGKSSEECAELLSVMEYQLEVAKKIVVYTETCDGPGLRSAKIRYLKY